jgi:hypothetical protein
MLLSVGVQCAPQALALVTMRLVPANRFARSSCACRTLWCGAVEGLLHPDFVEIGASGRVWDKASVLDSVSAESRPAPVVSDLHAEWMTADAMLVTCRARQTGRRGIAEGVRVAARRTRVARAVSPGHTRFCVGELSDVLGRATGRAVALRAVRDLSIAPHTFGACSLPHLRSPQEAHRIRTPVTGGQFRDGRARSPI